MYILHNISRSKANQTIKFGLLIEYNKRNIFFLKKNTQNVVEKTKCGGDLNKITILKSY